MRASKTEFRRELAKEVAHHNGVDPEVVARWIGEGGASVQAPHQAIPAAELGRLAHSIEVAHEGGERFHLAQGAVVIAAITSCTNTSNPSVMLGAGLLAKKAVERGLSVKPWVKTSLAPGSKVVTDYLSRAGLTEYLERLRFHLVGYGCTTCIGNSGPMPEAIAAAIKERRPGGVRCIERQPQLRGPYQSVRTLQLSSLAAAGSRLRDRGHDELSIPSAIRWARISDGKPVYLRDIWPSPREVAKVVGRFDRFRDVP